MITKTFASDVNPAAQLSSQPAAPVVSAEHAEPVTTRVIEQVSAKIPSHFFLVASLSAMGLSAALELRGKSRASRFVGMWPASLLIMGIYNKIVKNSGVS